MTHATIALDTTKRPRRRMTDSQLLNALRAKSAKLDPRVARTAKQRQESWDTLAAGLRAR